MERKLNYPFGKYDGLVLCFVPPFIKRIRIKGKWIGFDKKWKFIFMKDDKKEVNKDENRYKN